MNDIDGSSAETVAPAQSPVPPSGRVVVMTAGGANPALVIEALAQRFPDLHVLMENAESKAEIYRRRARRLGHLQAAGQLATMIVTRSLRGLVRARVEAIIRSTGLKAEIPAHVPVTAVTSINGDDCRTALERLAPDVVLLVSTRLMSRAALAALSCPVINLHAGINPAYRGQMGGYWSLAENDAGNFGATLHLVDAGTDTGSTLHEVRVTPDRRDMISTYPLLLTAAALPITVRSVEEAIAGTLAPVTPSGPSALRFPPTLWVWIANGIRRGVW